MNMMGLEANDTVSDYVQTIAVLEAVAYDLSQQAGMYHRARSLKHSISFIKLRLGAHVYDNLKPVKSS